MTTPNDLTSDPWSVEAPEADVQEQLQAAFPDPGSDPEEPLAQDGVPVPADDADEADVVEQARDLPWEDSDEER